MVVNTRCCTAAVAIIGLVVGAAGAIAAPKAKLWERWTAHDAAASSTIDHAAWRRFLKAYVRDHPDGITRVAYDVVTPADDTSLREYISALEAVPISRFNRDEQLAYWINLYNAVTVRVILDHYPVTRILDIKLSPSFFSFGPWDK